jgi:hypothetical protein
MSQRSRTFCVSALVLSAQESQMAAEQCLWAISIDAALHPNIGADFQADIATI